MISCFAQSLSSHSPQRRVVTCCIHLWIIAAGAESNNVWISTIKTRCNAILTLQREFWYSTMWWCINSMHSGGLAQTTTITWLQWVPPTPTCLPLVSGSGSSLLRQQAVGGGGCLPNSSMANLTAPGPFCWYSVEETHLYYMLYGGIYRACSLEEIEIKGHCRQGWEILPQDSGGVRQGNNSVR